MERNQSMVHSLATLTGAIEDLEDNWQPLQAITLEASAALGQIAIQYQAAIAKYREIAIKFRKEWKAIGNARETLAAERSEFEREKAQAAALARHAADTVELNIGGEKFVTVSRAHLMLCPESMLAAMFSGRHQLATDTHGRVFVDRNPQWFAYVLDYLRNDCQLPALPTDPGALANIKREFDYFLVPAFDTPKAPLAKLLSQGRFTRETVPWPRELGMDQESALMVPEHLDDRRIVARVVSADHPPTSHITVYDQSSFKLLLTVPCERGESMATRHWLCVLHGDCDWRLYDMDTSQHTRTVTARGHRKIVALGRDYLILHKLQEDMAGDEEIVTMEVYDTATGALVGEWDEDSFMVRPGSIVTGDKLVLFGFRSQLLRVRALPVGDVQGELRLPGTHFLTVVRQLACVDDRVLVVTRETAPFATEQIPPLHGHMGLTVQELDLTTLQLWRLGFGCIASGNQETMVTTRAVMMCTRDTVLTWRFVMDGRNVVPEAWWWLDIQTGLRYEATELAVAGIRRVCAGGGVLAGAPANGPLVIFRLLVR